MVEVNNIILGLVALLFFGLMVMSAIIFTFVWVTRLAEQAEARLKEWFNFQ